MRSSASIHEFVADPIGRFIGGSAFLVWCRAPDLCGTVLWGRPNADEIGRVVQLWEFDRKLAVPYDAVTDTSRIAGVDGSAFSVLVDYVRSRVDHYAAAVGRHAVVHGGGVDGAAVAGFFPVVDGRHPWRTFTDPVPAFEWLQRSDGAEACSEVEALVRAAMGVPATLGLLRQQLSGALEGASIERSARALTLSPRTLQRELQAAGTSFRAELDQARMEAARRLLVETDDRLDDIALAVGLTSKTDLARFVRRLDGRTPSEVRAAGRAGRK